MVNPDPNIFHLLVKSREGEIFNGEVNSITSYNDKGKFDVLAYHANFICLIRDYLIIRSIDGKVQNIEVGNGLMKVDGNNVQVYLGIENIANTRQKSSI